MLESKQRQIAEAEQLPIPTVRAIIDGKPSGAASGKTLAVVSPINGDTIAAIPDCEGADVDRAVAGARKAFASRSWQGMNPKQRKLVMLDWADRLAANPSGWPRWKPATWACRSGSPAGFRYRRRGDRDCQRHEIRARSLDLVEQSGERALYRQAAGGRQHQRQWRHRTRGRASLRWVQAIGLWPRSIVACDRQIFRPQERDHPHRAIGIRARRATQRCRAA